MSEYEELIGRLFRALNDLDYETAGALYRDDAVFSDPVFPELHGEEVRMMWRMLLEFSDSLSMKVSNIRVDGNAATADWEASYLYGKEKRPVLNRVKARFEFKDGGIFRHTDSFSLPRWISMAHGWGKGAAALLPPARDKVRAEAKKALDLYTRRMSRKKK